MAVSSRVVIDLAPIDSVHFRVMSSAWKMVSVVSPYVMGAEREV
jgi:hypothetical protein